VPHRRTSEEPNDAQCESKDVEFRTLLDARGGRVEVEVGNEVFDHIYD
jgi:hypothetical protein